MIHDTPTDKDNLKEFSAPAAPAPAGRIPLSAPYLQGNEWKYIKECLDTNWVSSVGSFVDRFEEMVAAYVGAKYAVATINGTSALHVALLVAGVQPDDEVLVSTLTFIAPANAIRYVGAWPVFVDAEPDYWQMDTGKVKRFLEEECNREGGSWVNKTSGRRVSAILPVHILGNLCDHDALAELARRYDLPLVEDATEALGAGYKDRLAGHLGDIDCLSFNGNKIITTGGGGMIVTDNPQWADRARYLTTQAKDHPVEYIHNEIGFNYRLTNVLAALGVAQMEQLAGFVEQRRRIAQVYDEAFLDMAGITPMPPQPNTDPTCWLYSLMLPESTSLEQRTAMMSELNEEGIGARPLWHPIHGLPPYAGSQTLGGGHADDIYRRALSLPSSASLNPEEQMRCIDAVRKGISGLGS